MASLTASRVSEDLQDWTVIAVMEALIAAAWRQHGAALAQASRAPAHADVPCTSKGLRRQPLRDRIDVVEPVTAQAGV